MAEVEEQGEATVGADQRQQLQQQNPPSPRGSSNNDFRTVSSVTLNEIETSSLNSWDIVKPPSSGPGSSICSVGGNVLNLHQQQLQGSPRKASAAGTLDRPLTLGCGGAACGIIQRGSSCGDDLSSRGDEETASLGGGSSQQNWWYPLDSMELDAMLKQELGLLASSPAAAATAVAALGFAALAEGPGNLTCKDGASSVKSASACSRGSRKSSDNSAAAAQPQSRGCDGARGDRGSKQDSKENEPAPMSSKSVGPKLVGARGDEERRKAVWEQARGSRKSSASGFFSGLTGSKKQQRVPRSKTSGELMSLRNFLNEDVPPFLFATVPEHKAVCQGA